MAKSILITGCSSGIGWCVAQGLKARGYRVFAAARKPEDVKKLRDEGFESIQLDLDDSASIQAAVEQVIALTGGTLDALFNNGAYGQTGAVEDLSRAVLRAQFETNLFGTHELTTRIIPIMRRQGHGRIIQISSLLGLVSLPVRGAYSASKFAFESLSDALRIELKNTGIFVSIIDPGPILTRFRANSLRAFKENIDIENSPHREKYRATLSRLSAEGAAVPLTLGPEAVLKKALHALESPRPKPRYYVTVPTHVFAVLRRVLPYRMMDWVVGRRF